MWNRLHISAPANYLSLFITAVIIWDSSVPTADLLTLAPGLQWTWCVSIIFRRAALDYIIVIRDCWGRRKSRWSLLLEISAQKTGALSYLPTSHWSEHATWSYPSSNHRKICPSSPSLERWQSQMLRICVILTQEGLRNCANGFILSCWGRDHTTCLSLHNFVDYTLQHL